MKKHALYAFLKGDKKLFVDLPRVTLQVKLLALIYKCVHVKYVIIIIAVILTAIIIARVIAIIMVTINCIIVK